MPNLGYWGQSASIRDRTAYFDGGSVVVAGGFAYHTITTSCTLTNLYGRTVTMDVLRIGGGGGSGYPDGTKPTNTGVGGGGSAGEYAISVGVVVAATSPIVTVGLRGSMRINGTTSPGNGGSTDFTGLATVGGGAGGGVGNNAYLTWKDGDVIPGGVGGGGGGGYGGSGASWVGVGGVGSTYSGGNGTWVSASLYAAGSGSGAGGNGLNGDTAQPYTWGGVGVTLSGWKADGTDLYVCEGGWSLTGNAGDQPSNSQGPLACTYGMGGSQLLYHANFLEQIITFAQPGAVIVKYAYP